MTEYAPDGSGDWGYDQYEVNPPSSANGAEWALYAWSEADYWGSSNVPLRRFWATAAGAIYVNSSVPPAPMFPVPVYPNDGNLNVPRSGTQDIPVRWTKGLDADRDNPNNWPATYEVWFKHWDFGTTEPLFYQLSATLPCNPDSSGICQTFVPNLSPGHWRWFLIINLNVSSSVSLQPTVFQAQGPLASFDVP